MTAARTTKRFRTSLLSTSLGEVPKAVPGGTGSKGIEIDEDCRRWISACPLCQLKNVITPRIHKKSEKLSADWRPIKGTVWIVDIWFFKDLLAKAEIGGFGMMVVLYEPEAGFSLTYPAKEKDEASLINYAYYFAHWLGRPHLVCMDGEKAGAGAFFQSWLRGDGSPGLYPIKYRQGPPYVDKGLQALVERCFYSNREGVALLMSDPNHLFPLAVIHIVHPEYLQTVLDNIRLWGRPRFDQEGTILLAPAGREQEDPRLWKTSARQEGGTGARYCRRARKSDLRHRGFPLVLPVTFPVGRYEGMQQGTQWPAKKFSFQLADEGEGVVGLREAPRLTHLREGLQEISSTEAQALASLSSSSALPSAVPPSPPPSPRSCKALRILPCLGRGLGKGSGGSGRPPKVSVSCCVKQGFRRLRGVAAAGFLCPVWLFYEGNHSGPVRP
uniref:Uncharacterized protein n=1 Tax=Chromera velia CCMP2878 TaxID=1169474 RepID=A0A0G4H6J2_9ALVE|eukprot:Cvel_24890.t1-p1 / transcript=Cvel_24890.t1 / gene=Cvel_24890 / organism=Chromera_velia_CCMP2878 / gene_product=hypothetical protein / transcript_product=hypothetical protein / location=Cvel_scaffold2751:16414-18434(-) / protein_length=441 / sequence_SO=supercontig / SO=protein_coding / is_pseudo=false